MSAGAGGRKAGVRSLGPHVLGGNMAQRFAQVFGVIYIVVGVIGFVPGVTTMISGVDGPFYGSILGLFPVNAVHDILHVLLGGWGLLASKSAESSRAFARWLAFLLILLAILGWIPGTSMLFG